MADCNEYKNEVGSELEQVFVYAVSACCPADSCCPVHLSNFMFTFHLLFFAYPHYT